jgi:hypothetical protein
MIKEKRTKWVGNAAEMGDKKMGTKLYSENWKERDLLKDPLVQRR